MSTGDDVTGGLALSRAFYGAVGNVLWSAVPDIMGKAAVGLVGEGSECFGFDDAISRDHDWGPAFCIWLPARDLEADADRLEEALRLLPGTFRGIPSRMAPERRIGRVGPLAVESFYGRLGIPRIPRDLRDWRRVEETSLAVCTNGEVFEDGPGVFTEWRNALLAYYPEDIRRKKIAARCMNASQTGQYNVIRCLQRGDYAGAAVCMARFVENMLSLGFLLERRCMPFYKWACRAARLLPSPARDVVDLAERLAEAHWRRVEWGMGTVGMIDELCSMFAASMREQGLTSVKGNWLWAIGEDVQAGIADASIRALDTMRD